MGREGQKVEYDKRDRDGAKNTSRQREAEGGGKEKEGEKEGVKSFRRQKENKRAEEKRKSISSALLLVTSD